MFEIGLSRITRLAGCWPLALSVLPNVLSMIQKILVINYYWFYCLNHSFLNLFVCFSFHKNKEDWAYIGCESDATPRDEENCFPAVCGRYFYYFWIWKVSFLLFYFIFLIFFDFFFKKAMLIGVKDCLLQLIPNAKLEWLSVVLGTIQHRNKEKSWLM